MSTKVTLSNGNIITKYVSKNDRDLVSLQPGGKYSRFIVEPMISMGTLNAIAMNSDGTLVGWGDESIPDTPLSFPDIDDFTQVSIGELYHAVGLRLDGTVVCWGNNSWGANNVPEGLTDVVQVVAGRNNTVALKSDGTCVMWGINFLDQQEKRGKDVDIVKIDQGSDHTVALNSSNIAVTWGRDSGNGLHTTKYNVVDVAAGGYWNCAITTSGNIIHWGEQAHYQHAVPAGNNFIGISAGHGHGVGLRDDGTVACWGLNDHGQATTPAGLVDVVAVSASGMESAALKSDGTIVAWGQDIAGQTSGANGHILT